MRINRTKQQYRTRMHINYSFVRMIFQFFPAPSFSMTVRLKTSLEAEESRSTQKNPIRSNWNLE